MSSSDTTTPELNNLMAAEYVLRLLNTREERSFEERLANDRGLMRHVARWSEHLAGLDDEVAPAKPRRSVKKALEERLFGKTDARPIWQKLGLWQGVSMASLALAGFLSWQTVQAPQPGQPPVASQGTLYLSEIAAEDQSLRVLAVYDSARETVRVTRTSGAAAPGRALELWAIAEGNAPVSLGVLPETQGGDVTLPEALRPGVAGLTLAISDEPMGGSPTGAPTGDVLAVGQVTEL